MNETEPDKKNTSIIGKIKGYLLKKEKTKATPPPTEEANQESGRLKGEQEVYVIYDDAKKEKKPTAKEKEFQKQLKSIETSYTKKEKELEKSFKQKQKKISEQLHNITNQALTEPLPRTHKKMHLKEAATKPEIILHPTNPPMPPISAPEQKIKPQMPKKEETTTHPPEEGKKFLSFLKLIKKEGTAGPEKEETEKPETQPLIETQKVKRDIKRLEQLQEEEEKIMMQLQKKPKTSLPKKEAPETKMKRYSWEIAGEEFRKKKIKLSHLTKEEKELLNQLKDIR